MSVRVTGLPLETSEAQLREFFSYCGSLSTVVLTPDTDTASSFADVTFEHPDSVEIAELLSGAFLNGAPITVTRLQPFPSSVAANNNADPASPPHPHSAVRAVDGLTVKGLLAGGEQVLQRIRSNAVELDTKYGIRNKITAGANVVAGAVTSAAKTVTGRNDVGEVTVESYQWKANQPQWGRDPKLVAQAQAQPL